MFVSGNQIKAARALVGWNRDQLAIAAGLHPNAVKYWERKLEFSDRETVEPVGLQRIQDALASAGVTATADPVTGVFLSIPDAS